MPKQFRAIPVGQGDAFFYECNGRRALIDGGGSLTAFPEQFRNATGCNGVDVVVCTHNDSDHANGLIGFLEAGLGVSELWLPATWTARLEDMQASADFLDELVQNVQEAAAREAVDVETFARTGEVASRERPALVLGDADAKPINGVVDAADLHPGSIGWLSAGKGLRDAMLVPKIIGTLLASGSHAASILADALSAAERILRLAWCAYDRGIPVRWLHHDTSLSGRGIRHFLRPVSAVEARYSGPPLTALQYLSLTVVNEESLVVAAPADDESSGVLFCADSRLAFGQRLPERIGVCTAPHHGAESAAAAYGRIDREHCLTSNATFVRSDSRTRSRPGPTYCLRQERKLCTVCRSQAAKQRVTLYVHRGQWRRGNGVRLCNCN